MGEIGLLLKRWRALRCLGSGVATAVTTAVASLPALQAPVPQKLNMRQVPRPYLCLHRLSSRRAAVGLLPLSQLRLRAPVHFECIGVAHKT